MAVISGTAGDLAATYDFEGDALIRLDSDTVMWLVGVSKAQLSAADFAIG